MCNSIILDVYFDLHMSIFTLGLLRVQVIITAHELVCPESENDKSAVQERPVQERL